MPLIDYFPLGEPRPKQVRAMEFIDRALKDGVPDIVIAAPTGVGKSGIGEAFCLSMRHRHSKRLAGAYYLVTQKLLQDQLERDTIRYPEVKGATIKSADAYPCQEGRLNCAVGRHKCELYVKGPCTYRMQKAKFCSAMAAITNYAYFFTERVNAAQLPARQGIVLDECHSVEEQIIKHVEVSVSTEHVRKMEFAVDIPDRMSRKKFLEYMGEVYLPKLQEHVRALIARAEESGMDSHIDAATKAEMHYLRSKNAISHARVAPHEWIFQTDKTNGDFAHVCRTTNAAPFFRMLLGDADARLHLSAFPGTKSVYCRSLGLDPDRVAWLKLGSDFPVQNRRIHALGIGSLSLSNRDDDLPRVCRVISALAKSHKEEKGLIHAHSYELARAAVAALTNDGFGDRVLFAGKADEREPLLKKHAQFDHPTILVSPSMTEGFDFADDLARWQVILKVPYPSLGDAHVAAKMEADRGWYLMRTAMALVQMAGRGVRHKDDRCVTYILDRDFEIFWDENKSLFPKWFREAVKFRS